MELTLMLAAWMLNIGDYVKSGEPEAQFHYNDQSLIKEAEDLLRSGLKIGPREIATRPLVLEVFMWL
jgi:hypothetical protein